MWLYAQQIKYSKISKKVFIYEQWCPYLEQKKKYKFQYKKSLTKLTVIMPIIFNRNQILFQKTFFTIFAQIEY